MKRIDKNLHPYVKIFINPFHNNTPKVLIDQIKIKRIPLSQLKSGGSKFKSFEDRYGAPNSHTAQDRPLSRKEKEKVIKPDVSLSNKQKDVIKCFECNREHVISSTYKLNQKEKGLVGEIKQTIHFRCGTRMNAGYNLFIFQNWCLRISAVFFVFNYAVLGNYVNLPP